jgi:hypothetical protein
VAPTTAGGKVKLSHDPLSRRILFVQGFKTAGSNSECFVGPGRKNSRLLRNTTAQEHLASGRWWLSVRMSGKRCKMYNFEVVPVSREIKFSAAQMGHTN